VAGFRAGPEYSKACGVQAAEIARSVVSGIQLTLRIHCTHLSWESPCASEPIKNGSESAASKKKTSSKKARTRATAKRSGKQAVSSSEVVYSDIRSALQSSILSRLL
jgi:hypothetical protein